MSNAGFSGGSRREFLRKTGAGALAGWGFGFSAWPRRESRGADGKLPSPNEKLNLGIIGTANRAEGNIAGVVDENIAALCDIDAKYLARAAARFPNATTDRDFRRLLERPGIDAVVISTPDHAHAPAALAAIALGKHVYCEKPLSHNTRESRLMREAAAKAGVATQMGIQIHAGDNYRRVTEVIRAGVLGRITEVHAWVGKAWGGGERPTDRPEVPAHIDWDLWLGPAPERPYHPTYLPANWRRWWDFGSGTLGDMACHYLDLPFWALNLTRPTRIRAMDGGEPHPETAPERLRVEWDFPEHEGRAALKVFWHDGGLRPEALSEPGMPRWGDGVLFVGEKGMMLADYGRYKLLPESEFADFEPPPRVIPDSIGHHREWIEACKTGSPTTCDFNYSANLSEAVLLGTVAFRAGEAIEWDAEALRVTNHSGANAFVGREYRKGWELG